MNPQHLLIDNACRIEVLAEYNQFTDEQKKDLLRLLDKFQAVKPTNIFKFSKTLKSFEDAFIKFGGNHGKLEESIKKIRDETYISVTKATGLKIVKDEVK